jgi:hypothetical protein
VDLDCKVLRIGYSGAIATSMRSFKQQDKAEFTDICIVTVYIVVHHFLQSYNLQKVKLSICYDRCEVGVDNKLIDWFLTNLLLGTTVII